MPYKFSNCICLSTSNMPRAKKFYSEVIDLPIVNEDEKVAELGTGDIRLFIDQSDFNGTVIEFFVPDLEKAKQHLIEAGCRIIKWEGPGKCNYVRDPFGMVFNVYEDPKAF